MIAAKVDEIKRAALEELDHIEKLGGAIAAVEMGDMKGRLVESNTAPPGGDRAQRTDRHRGQSICRNRPSPLTFRRKHHFDRATQVEAEQVARLNAWRAARDEKAVAAALEE